MAGAYLAFALGERHYGLPVANIREIIQFSSASDPLQLPPRTTGIVNLRGKMMHVVNLRRKFGLACGRGGENLCVVAVQATTEAASGLVVGLMVDRVEEVIQVATHDIRPVGEVEAEPNARYIEGQANVNGRIQILLDTNKLLESEIFYPARNKSN